MIAIRCNDPRCKGNSCTVATIEDGQLVIIAQHRGEKHRATIPLDKLASIAN